jgi:hypothetical protein
MKARTKAIAGGIITCAISLIVGFRVPRLFETGQGIRTGINANQLTDVAILTCPFWWIVPFVMLLVLLITGRRRDPDATFFKVYYGAFNLVMALMMLLLIAGLMLPMMGRGLVTGDR